MMSLWSPSVKTMRTNDVDLIACSKLTVAPELGKSGRRMSRGRWRPGRAAVFGNADRSVASGPSGAVVQGDLVAVGVGEGERPAERAVDRCGDDGVTIGAESVVNGLDVGGVEPARGTDAGLGGGCQSG